MLLNRKKEWSIDTHGNLGECPGNYTEWKEKTITKGNILCDALYIMLWKLENYKHWCDAISGKFHTWCHGLQSNAVMLKILHAINFKLCVYETNEFCV
jgi:hypothetical protein